MASDDETKTTEVQDTINDHHRNQEEKTITENCDYVIGFIDQLSKANFDVMTGVSKQKIRQMKSTLEEFCVLHDEMTGNKNERKPQTVKYEIQTRRPEMKNKDEIPIKNKDYRESDATGYSSGDDSVVQTEDERSVRDSEDSSRKSRPRKRRENKSEERTLLDILGKFDTRKAADFPKFQEDKGQSLHDYLVSFEKYCKQNLRGESDTWVTELEKYLTGDCLKAFLGMNDLNESYESVKRSLLAWYDRRHELRKERVREQFNNITYEKGEGLFMYSTRIQKLFRRAYPKAKVETSTILIKKFIETLPKPERKKLSSIYQYDRLKKNPMGWSEIQDYCGLRDIELEKDKPEESEEEKEVIINIKKNIPKEKEQAQTTNVNSNVGYNQSQKQFYFSDGQGGQQKYPQQTQQTRYFRPQLPPRPNFFNQRQQHLQYNQFPPPYVPQIFFPPPNQNYFSAPPRQEARFCQGCKRMGHLQEHCWMKNRDCYNCGKLGHIRRICKNSTNNSNANQRSQSQPPTMRPQAHGNNQNNSNNNNSFNNNMPKVSMQPSN